MRKNLYLLMALALVTGGLAYNWLKPTAAVDATQTIALDIHQSKLQGSSVIKAVEGQRLIFRITADHADELHLHGYDLQAPLRANEPATLQFTATRTGRFPIELHHADVELGVLEVYPR